MKYAFKKDSLQWMLIENGSVKEGKNAGQPTEKTLGYYPSLEQAALKMLEHVTRDKCAEPVELSAILTALAEAKIEVIAAVRAVGSDAE